MAAESPSGDHWAADVTEDGLDSNEPMSLALPISVDLCQEEADPNEHGEVPRVGEKLEPTMAQAERKDSEVPADENPLALRTRDSNVYWREACGLVSKERLRYCDELFVF
ncbi:uncharacterized protein APUU_50407S [Aspergillus puulaauensis]|uniref:Uncharacterized protein n=1 Tax=Aspergillus puulaauensis TaxID=1220207 RepID=A0A7R7XQ65_9EURO|nr:uncharacterized protein APUU_50407S [Aspergillus puulaauensis]BCS25696.1 hypothetical protein APUU_50407S [Aspergillus puulaauensis]